MYKEGGTSRVMATFSFPLAKTIATQARLKLQFGSDPHLVQNLDPNAILVDVFMFGIEVFEGEYSEPWVEDTHLAMGKALMSDTSDPTGGREGYSDADFIVVLIDRIRDAVPRGHERRITAHINSHIEQGAIAAFGEPDAGGVVTIGETNNTVVIEGS